MRSANHFRSQAGQKIAVALLVMLTCLVNGVSAEDQIAASGVKDAKAEAAWLRHGFSDMQREKIRAALQLGIDQKFVPGGAMLIIHQGEPIFREGFGVASLDTRQAFTIDAPCRIASVTKPHTSTLIAMLVEQGKLSWDDPVDKHLPSFARIAVRDKGPAIRTPKVRELLSHTAGFPGQPAIDSGRWKIKSTGTLADAVADLPAQGLAAEPGTVYAYTGLGYMVAGRIAELVTGKEYGALMKAMLLEPIGAKAATFYLSDDLKVRMPTAYERKDGEFLKLDPASRLRATAAFPNPAGSLISTVDDVGRFLMLHRNRGQVDGKVLVKPESLQALYYRQPATGRTSYGLGFNVLKVNAKGEGVRVRHTGASGTFAQLDFENDLIFVLLTQVPQTQTQPFRDGLLKAVADVFSAADSGGKLTPALRSLIMPDRLVGITVLPEFLQVEGVDAVLNNLVMKAGANAVTTSPYVMEVADERTGVREPPDDAGAGAVRLLDRPLWGKRELFVRTAPSFVPQSPLYRGLRHQPAEPTDLTSRDGHVVHDLIRAAQSRHLKVYLQIQAAIPPGYRVQFGGPTDDDRPRLPDGSLPPRRLAKNGSLASRHIVEYTHALICDLCRAYPDIDGLRFDWPEYPPYLLDDLFLDFSEPAEQAAGRLSFDFVRMKRDALALYRKLHGGLTDADLSAWLDEDGGRYVLARWLMKYPGVLDLLRFKAALVAELLAGVRRTMNEAGAERMELIAHAFPPPWNLASGIDFTHSDGHVSGYCVKLYTMHWAMMLRFYADQLLAANRGLSDQLLGRTLVCLLDIADDQGLAKATDYHYSEPNEPHPAGSKAMQRKIRQTRQEAGDTPVYALAHGYGPADDFRRRLAVAWEASPAGIWVNRYGYLSDEKLQIIGETTRR